MTEAERDQLWARVFALRSAKHLIEDHRARGHFVITLKEIEQRVARARASWETGVPQTLLNEGKP